MEIMEQFEYPLPVLDIDTEKIVIETTGSCEGSFKIKNAGGGLLSGSIMSNSRAITFYPDSINKNDINVTYQVNPDVYKVGDVIHTGVVIMSNGGEKIIPIIIKITPPAIITKEDVKISTLKDFMAYSRRFPLPARQLFMSKDFMMWLISIEYEFMEAFEQLTKDPVKERAVDNFLILSGLKKKTKIMLLEDKIEVSLKPLQKGIYYGAIPIKKSGYGYVEEEVYTKNGAPWLKLSTDKVISADFGGEETAEIRFSIDTVLIKTKYAAETVCVGGDGCRACITVKRLPFLQVKLSKESFAQEDKGWIKITNHAGCDLMLDILLQDTFIKLEGKKYFVGEYAEIPFEVKLSAFQAAQMSIRKQPYLNTIISIRGNLDGTPIRKNVSLSVGEL